jgi:hypothetical protein
MQPLQLGLLLAATLSCLLSLLMWPEAARAYTAEQQQACSDDALRLCSAEIPDVDRVTVCMVRNKSRLSPRCRVIFRPGPEDRRPERHTGTGTHKPSKLAKTHHED